MVGELRELGDGVLSEHFRGAIRRVPQPRPLSPYVDHSFSFSSRTHDGLVGVLLFFHWEEIKGKSKAS